MPIAPIPPSPEKQLCIDKKAAYGLENLHFYKKHPKSPFCCRYIADPNNFGQEDPLDLDFILHALMIQQAQVYFEDVAETCKGMDELKCKYLIFKLSGII